MNRKICVITGGRAEYGLLEGVMQGIRRQQDLELQIIATGMHLSPEFGLTYREIESDGFSISRMVEMLVNSDSSRGVAKSMGLGLIGFADALADLQPDLVLVLGDRFEIFAAAAAALVARLPLGHIHGGEITEGAFDNAIRHSITKMAHLHFVAAEEYGRRVVQMGEDPKSVYLVGGLGVDNIKRLPLLERADLESRLGITFWRRNLLVTFHPVTLENRTAGEQMQELLCALETLTDTQLIFTMPNADPNAGAIIDLMKRFAISHSNACVFASLGKIRYLSCLRFVDGVVGNSSSGLTEAPTFRIGTINIGDRQRGRLKATSVIDCEPNREAIGTALNELYSIKFKEKLQKARNPYGEGGASKKIIDILLRHSLQGLQKKRFHDLLETPHI